MTTLTESENKKIKAALRILEKSATYNAEIFSSAEYAKDYFRLRIASSSREIFSVAFLATNNSLIAAEDMFVGTINQCSVFPREIAKRALELNAKSIIVSHNHPSGNASPSDADKNITAEMVRVMRMLDINVLDHIIVSRCETFSFAEKGIL